MKRASLEEEIKSTKTKLKKLEQEANIKAVANEREALKHLNNWQGTLIVTMLVTLDPSVVRCFVKYPYAVTITTNSITHIPTGTSICDAHSLEEAKVIVDKLLSSTADADFNEIYSDKCCDFLKIVGPIIGKGAPDKFELTPERKKKQKRVIEVLRETRTYHR